MVSSRRGLRGNLCRRSRVRVPRAAAARVGEGLCRVAERALTSPTGPRSMALRLIVFLVKVLTTTSPSSGVVDSHARSYAALIALARASSSSRPTTSRTSRGTLLEALRSSAKHESSSARAVAALAINSASLRSRIKSRPRTDTRSSWRCAATALRTSISRRTTPPCTYKPPRSGCMPSGAPAPSIARLPPPLAALPCRRRGAARGGGSPTPRQQQQQQEQQQQQQPQQPSSSSSRLRSSLAAAAAAAAAAQQQPFPQQQQQQQQPQQQPQQQQSSSSRSSRSSSSSSSRSSSSSSSRSSSCSSNSARRGAGAAQAASAALGARRARRASDGVRRRWPSRAACRRRRR